MAVLRVDDRPRCRAEMGDEFEDVGRGLYDHWCKKALHVDDQQSCRHLAVSLRLVCLSVQLSNVLSHILQTRGTEQASLYW